MSNTFSHTQNALLASLPADDIARFSQHLELIEMPFGMLLHEPGQVIDYVYFPINCIVSLMYELETGATIEIAVVGYEGVVGISSILGAKTTTSRAIVQVAGFGFRLKQTILKQEIERAGPVLNALLRFTQAMITLMGQTAVCNRYHSIEQQVCRWLLLSLDRQPLGPLTMTHELISNMLGVRREGVTEAAGRLQKAGFIKYNRGVIEVLDRAGLEGHVCECYKVVKEEFDRLLPSALQSH